LFGEQKWSLHDERRGEQDSDREERDQRDGTILIFLILGHLKEPQESKLVW
jgi:hypothetical protein